MNEHVTKEKLITTASAVSTTKTKQRRLLGRTPLDLPLALLLASAFIGLWAAYDRSLSWPLLTALLGSLALYLALTWPRFDAAVLRRLAWVLLLIQGTLALYFITQFNHLGYPVKMSFVSRLGRLTGGAFPAWGAFYPGPNALATFIEGGLPLAAGLWLSARGRWERLAAGLGFALLGYGLLLTASRGSWVAVAACAGLTLIVWAGRRLSSGWRLAGLATLIGLALAAGVGVVLIGPEGVPGLTSALTRGSDRLELYKNSLHLIGDYPLLGIGLGDTFAMVYSKYILLIPYAYLTYSHNLPLAIWLNQGLLGLVSFGWMLMAFYRLVVVGVRRGQGTPLLWGGVLGVTAMLVHGLTDAPQYADSRWVMPVFYALLGLSVANLCITNPRIPNLRVPNLRKRAALVTLLVALGIVTVFSLADTFYANIGAIHHARADLAPALDDAARQQTLDQAARYYRRALEIDGKQPVAHWRLGLIELNADRFPQAIEHLEITRSTLPGHRGVQKALGFAYLWDGQLDRAEGLLRPLNEVPQELGTWSWWRGEQGQDQLAIYARQLESRLRGTNPEQNGEE
jgi:putative inorganic carbon (HCO3(-)) transporter